MDPARAYLVLEAAGKLNPTQQQALDTLRRAGKFPPIRFAKDDPVFDRAEAAYKLPKGLLRAVTYGSENPKGDPAAESPTHVKGLMQITLGTGKKYGLTPWNRTNPYKNVVVGAQLLRDLLAEHKGDVHAALKAYKGHGELDMSDDDYLKHVEAAWPK